MKAFHYFSSRTGYFYDRRIHGRGIPRGARPIAAERFAELIQARSDGATIVADELGMPQIEKPAPPSAEQLRATLVRQIKREAGRRIEAAVPIWRQINDLAVLATHPSADVAWRDASANRAIVDRYRLLSNDLEKAVAALPDGKLASIDPRDDEHWPNLFLKRTHRP